MSIFPTRGRRDNTVDSSWMDLEAPPPLTEKRRQSPFSYLRNRKRSTDTPTRKSPGSSPKDIESLPPVPPVLGHNRRNYSDPQLIHGALVYPQTRSGGSETSSESVVLPPTPPARSSEFTSHMRESILPTAHALLPTPTPMMAAAAVIAAQAQRRHHTDGRVIDGLPESGGHGHGGRHHQGAVHSLLATAEMDKAKVAATVGPLITMGLQNLTKAQTVVEDVTASEAWGVVKENVTAVLAPAHDIIVILDSVTKYIPAVMVAESVLSLIVKHELERMENEKNILVVYHTMTTFWFTLCDLQTIFRAAAGIKRSLDTFFEEVKKTMEDFGNFSEVYYKHGHFARTLRSSQYRNKLTGFAQSFVDHKAQLQFLLTESSALQITDMSTNVSSVSAKLESVTEKLDKALAYISRQTPLEVAVEKRVQESGGEAALGNPQFLDELAKSHFGATEGLPAQVHASLQQGLDEALAANMPAFAMRVEAAQKEMAEAVERSTETILQQLNSGPHELIKDEDIKTVWKSMNWRISCKSRHFVDAVHNHFSQKFGEHQKSAGQVHPEQWTLNVLRQVIYYPNIADAIDDDGSGYISVQEVNHFFKSRPTEWSAVQWLSFWAVGWKQNALAYKTRCKALFSALESSARTVMPQNRQSVKAYIKSSGLSELWLVVNSLTADSTAPSAHGRMHHAPETGPLNALREEIMRLETERFKSRLERIQYQLESPETILAILGTHRLEGFILCFLDLILERHQQIIETANTMVLSDREFHAMTASLRNLVTAFSARYHTLIQSWKQQRLETDFLVQCFAGGIFNDWHEVFQDHPPAYQDTLGDVPQTPGLSMISSAPRTRSPPPLPEQILVFPLPPQPSASKASFDNASPPLGLLAPPPHPRGPRRRSVRRSAAPGTVDDYFYHFDFEKRPSERRISNAGGAGPDSIPEVYRKKTKKPKLEDRITSLETELSEIKGMLCKLISLSTPTP
ncbi:hypothetical protein FB45DRAFT_805383 [Roridomyces roridus]|uniref:EF-hand domain-containing protein n=1 Tax=Roridomyces roridus TaxID=1738132 RepID=A0AAD7B435_9AGAR|nr:hypothetical protein FB45DRAFT_805383 [Roridomyces roridus]